MQLHLSDNHSCQGDTAAWPRATDARHARAGNGDRPRTNPSPAAAAVAWEPECVFRSCLGLLKNGSTLTLRPKLGRLLDKAIDCRPARPGRAGPWSHRRQPWRRRSGRVGLLGAASRPSGLIFTIAQAAASERAAALPLAFAIAHSANRLTADGATVVCLVAARLQRCFMASRPVAQEMGKNF